MHTHAVWLHSDSVWNVREDADGVTSVLAVDEAVSLEVKAVDVWLWTHSWQVPCHFIRLTHGQAWEVPIHKPIDGWKREINNISKIWRRNHTALWLQSFVISDQCVDVYFLRTVHLVALHKALVLLVNSGGSSGEGPDVVIQIPTQILIKHCGHEVELFVVVFLHVEKGDKRRGHCKPRCTDTTRSWLKFFLCDIRIYTHNL